MIITFENYPKKLRPITEKALNFYASKLMSKRLINNLCIMIEGESGLIDGYMNATCTWEYDWNRPRDFVININTKLEIEEILTALAHEMVHVKQFARSELKERFYPEKRTVWFEKPINTKKIEYWDLPWEIEAHGRERGLYVRFVQEEKLNLLETSVDRI